MGLKASRSHVGSEANTEHHASRGAVVRTVTGRHAGIMSLQQSAGNHARSGMLHATRPTRWRAWSRWLQARVCDALVSKLSSPERTWAAEVLFASTTGHEADIVNSFANDPEGWWEALGETAKGRWQEWLDDVKGELVWDREKSLFIEGQHES